MPVLLRLVRFSNLLIIALTQCLLQYLVLLPVFRQAGLSPILTGNYFFLFVFTTMLIAAGGYVVNDLADYEIDLENKPEKVFINHLIPKKNAWIFYAGIFFTGQIIALFLAFYVKNLPLSLIYPAAFGLLAWYSFYLKKIPLVGNAVVALFCAFVAGVVWFAERETFGLLLATNPAAASETGILFGGYLAFAFLSTMFREIVKDMEDVLGDKNAGHRTLPVVYGLTTAKRWAAFFGLLLLTLLVLFATWLWEKEKWAGFAFCIAGVVLPLIFSLFLLRKADNKAQFSKLSTISKSVMVAGLILLLLL